MSDIKDNQIELLMEELECVHMKLDKIGAPRKDKIEGMEFSINGRIQWLIDQTVNVINTARNRKITKDFTPEDDHLIWLENQLRGNGAIAKCLICDGSGFTVTVPTKPLTIKQMTELPRDKCEHCNEGFHRG